MRKKAEQCAVCGGKLVSRKVRHDQHWGDKIVVFEDVPARVCLSCGETWLSSKVVRTIDKLLTKQNKPRKRMLVPVWSLSNLKAA